MKKKGGRERNWLIFSPVFTVARVLEVISSSHEFHYNAKTIFQRTTTSQDMIHERFEIFGFGFMEEQNC